MSAISNRVEMTSMENQWCSKTYRANCPGQPQGCQRGLRTRSPEYHHYCDGQIDKSEDGRREPLAQWKHDLSGDSTRIIITTNRNNTIMAPA